MHDALTYNIVAMYNLYTARYIFAGIFLVNWISQYFIFLDQATIWASSITLVEGKTYKVSENC